MRTDNLQGSTAPASSAASLAFQTAFVQQKQFEETIARVSEKQLKAAKETQAAKEETHQVDRVKDFVDVNNGDNKLKAHEVAANAANAATSAAPPPGPSVGAKVNVSV